MRCVILGGSGFLGQHVSRTLSVAGHEVWLVDQKSPPVSDYSQAVSGFVQADFSDVESWSVQCKEPIDAVIHLASSTVPVSANDDPLNDAAVNLLGTLKLIKGLSLLPVKPRLLFASSGGAVYGVPQSVPLDEDHSTVPLGAYGITKLAIEHHLRVAESLYGIDSRILRLSNPYGEWQSPFGAQGVIAVFAYKALRGQPVDVWGDGSVVRDFVYAADIGRAFLAALTHAGPHRVFNVGGGNGHSVNHIIRTLEHLLGHPIERRVLPARPFDPPVNVLDVRRARDELGWKPRVAFEEGVAKTLEWLRQSC